MRDVEELLRRDRRAGLPEPPDARYTAAAVRHRLGRTPVETTGNDIDWIMIAACAALAVGGALLAVALGLSPWWLLLLPGSVFPLLPILLRKGAR